MYFNLKKELPGSIHHHPSYSVRSMPIPFSMTPSAGHNLMHLLRTLSSTPMILNPALYDDMQCPTPLSLDVLDNELPIASQFPCSLGIAF